MIQIYRAISVLQILKQKVIKKWKNQKRKTKKIIKYGYLSEIDKLKMELLVIKN